METWLINNGWSLTVLTQWLKKKKIKVEHPSSLFLSCLLPTYQSQLAFHGDLPSTCFLQKISEKGQTRRWYSSQDESTQGKHHLRLCAKVSTGSHGCPLPAEALVVTFRTVQTRNLHLTWQFASVLQRGCSSYPPSFDSINAYHWVLVWKTRWMDGWISEQEGLREILLLFYIKDDQGVNYIVQLYLSWAVDNSRKSDPS